MSVRSSTRPRAPLVPNPTPLVRMRSSTRICVVVILVYRYQEKPQSNKESRGRGCASQDSMVFVQVQKNQQRSWLCIWPPRLDSTPERSEWRPNFSSPVG